MARLFFGFQSPAGDLDVAMQIAETDAPRLMAYLMGSSYGSVSENVQSEAPDAAWRPGESETEADRPRISTQQWVTRPATMEEAAENYARVVLAQLLNETVMWERAQAASAAAAAVQPIKPIG
jgi:hypothetical protein